MHGVYSNDPVLLKIQRVYSHDPVLELNYVIERYYKNENYKEIVKDVITRPGFWDRYKEKITSYKTHALWTATYSESCVIIRTLLENGADVFDKDSSGNTAIELAIELNLKEIYQTFLEYGYKNCNNYVECRRVLMALLKHCWFGEFEKFFEITSINLYTFFHTINLFHFPFHELCAGSNSQAVRFLISKYSTEILNIRSILDREVQPLNPLKHLLESRYLHFGHAEICRNLVTCPEQELAWCLSFDVCGYYSYPLQTKPLLSNHNFLKDGCAHRKREITKMLFDMNIFSNQTIQQMYEKKNEEEKEERTASAPYQRNLFLEIAYYVKDYDFITTIEKIIGYDVYSLSLQYPTLNWWDSSQMIIRLIKKGADYLKPRKYYKLYQFEFKANHISPIMLMLIYPPVVEAISYIYKQHKMPVNKMYNIDDQDMTLLDFVVNSHTSYVLMERKICLSQSKGDILKIINVMYAAGEKFTLKSVSARIHYAKHFRQDKQVTNYSCKSIHDLPLQICPYRGPEKDNSFCCAGENQFMPTLFQIARKEIRKSIYKCNNETNLYDAVDHLRLPHVIRNSLLFNME